MTSLNYLAIIRKSHFSVSLVAGEMARRGAVPRQAKRAHTKMIFWYDCIIICNGHLPCQNHLHTVAEI